MPPNVALTPHLRAHLGELHSLNPEHDTDVRVLRATVRFFAETLGSYPLELLTPQQRQKLPQAARAVEHWQQEPLPPEQQKQELVDMLRDLLEG